MNKLIALVVMGFTASLIAGDLTGTVTLKGTPPAEKEITDNGWAVWPPIRFGSNTINLDLPTAAPSPPMTRGGGAVMKEETPPWRKGQVCPDEGSKKGAEAPFFHGAGRLKPLLAEDGVPSA